MDSSSPGSSVHGIFQARVLEWVAMPSSRGSSDPKIECLMSPALAGGFFTTSTTLEAPIHLAWWGLLETTGSVLSGLCFGVLIAWRQKPHLPFKDNLYSEWTRGWCPDILFPFSWAFCAKLDQCKCCDGSWLHHWPLGNRVTLVWMGCPSPTL